MVSRVLLSALALDSSVGPVGWAASTALDGCTITARPLSWCTLAAVCASTFLHEICGVAKCDYFRRQTDSGWRRRAQRVSSIKRV